VGVVVSGTVDPVRRALLRNHHTATHIVYASCRRVLGPHVWQNGAKKTIHQAHLDITHYSSLTFQQQLEIQAEANRLVHSGKSISKGFMAKDEAEKLYGFHLYQGGVVPGNELRVVNIADTDTEACCGTHADNTSEVGFIKIIKTNRISDGIVRLYYVAGDLALSVLDQESCLIQALTAEWGVHSNDLKSTANRFFEGYKKYSAQIQKQSVIILELRMKLFLSDSTEASNRRLWTTEEPNPTLFISNLPQFANRLKEKKKSVVVVGSSFFYALLGEVEAIDQQKLEQKINQIQQQQQQQREEKSKFEEEKGSRRGADSSSVLTASSAKPFSLKVVDSLSVSSGKDRLTGKKVVDRITGIKQMIAVNLSIKAELLIDYFKSLQFTLDETETPI